MSDEIHVRFRCEEREFVAASRIHMNRRFRTRRDTWLCLMLLAVISGFWIVNGYSWFFALVAALLLLVLMLQTYLHVVAPRAAYRSEPRYGDENEATFSDKEITVRARSVSSRLGWDFYLGWLESRDLFLIYHAKDGFSVLPKRAFASPEDEARFRTLLQSKLPGDRA